MNESLVYWKSIALTAMAYFALAFMTAGLIVFVVMQVLGENENSVLINQIILLISAAFYLRFLKRIFRYILEEEVAEATCKNCGVPYQISTSKEDFITSSVPRTTIQNGGLDSKGNPNYRRLVSWTEQIGYTIVTTQCNACGDASSRRKNFNRKVNKESGFL